MPKHCENVRKTRGIANKCSYIVGSEFAQFIPMIIAFIDEQAGKLLHPSDGIRESQLGVPTTTVTSNCDK